MKTSRYAVVLGGLLLVSSCSNHVKIKMHSLTKPSPGEVARVDESFAYVLAVDGQHIKRDYMDGCEIEIAPGNHTLEVRYANAFAGHYSTNTAHAALRAVGGHKYRVSGFEGPGTEDNKGAWYCTVDDVTYNRWFRLRFTVGEETYSRTVEATSENDAEAKIKSKFPNASNIRIK